jgi:hypothetical protein
MRTPTDTNRGSHLNINHERPGASPRFFALCVGAILGGFSGLLFGIFIGWIIWG